MMPEKQANPSKNRAPMIRSSSSKQLTIPEFYWPFQVDLDENNRWVKMSQHIPPDGLADAYYQGFSSETGRPEKEARLVIGAVIIKHKLCLSDEETVQKIQENPYMQYFTGLASYQMEAPFTLSLFVEIRKRMGQSVFEQFHCAIIEAHDGEKEKIRLRTENQENLQDSAQEQDLSQVQPDDCPSPASEKSDNTEKKTIDIFPK